MEVPKENQILLVIRKAWHGDQKTASVFPERWPDLEKGSKVRFIKQWNNFYGIWWTVEGPNGSEYDIEPWKLRSIANNRGQGD